jgi:hypothetical protein
VILHLGISILIIVLQVMVCKVSKFNECGCTFHGYILSVTDKMYPQIIHFLKVTGVLTFDSLETALFEINLSDDGTRDGIQ